MRNLIKDDMDDRNAKLLKEADAISSELSSKNKISIYAWIAILVIFALQIITLLKFLR
ncbi:MAG: hypothetical protein LBT96_05100 [Campylobacteraceae bacterium]|nr:hypothetical protein [Campylobacteraceae bacterium]